MDFNKMMEDMTVALQKDEKYQKENDAKFRAVAQRVESYKDFESIVKGCHLRPLDKKEAISTVANSVPAWNCMAKTSGSSNLHQEVLKYFPQKRKINGNTQH